MKQARVNSKAMRIKSINTTADEFTLIGLYLAGLILFSVGLTSMPMWYHIVFAAPLITVICGHLFEIWIEKGYEIREHNDKRQETK